MSTMLTIKNWMISMISNMTTINKYDDKCEYNDDNDNHLCTPDYRFANQNKTWVASSSDH